MANETIYEMVTAKIIEQLEAGVIPWRKPWINGGAVNWKTQKPYRGINTMLLSEGEYATFKQITEAGGKVKKGAKSSFVIFWKWLEKENEVGELEKIPFLRYYRVFEINTQVEGLESKRKAQTFDHNPIEKCEEIFKGYINRPTIAWERKGAYYVPSEDHINMPPMKDFTKVEEYYSTLFHEMAHSTGHKSRLNREGITSVANFGSETYSKEELVAEMTASMLCGVAGIDNSTIENSASYIKSWLGKLKEDKTLLVKAGGQAQRASDHILNIKWEE
jgi:antirestriction protein ArdC